MLTLMSGTRPDCVLEQRFDEIGRWLDDEAPFARFDQRHLDAGTPEQAYWHLGYMTALRDALRHLKGEAGCTSDTSSPPTPDGRDG